MNVVAFISKFSGAKDFFLDGGCYWFARILCDVFPGEIYYNTIDGHFVALIKGRYYDARGDVTDCLKKDAMCLWNDYVLKDPLHYARITRDCILYLDNSEITKEVFVDADANR